MSKKVEIEVEGKKLAVSNLEKVLYPKVGFTKGQVIDYYWYFHKLGDVTAFKKRANQGRAFRHSF